MLSPIEKMNYNNGEITCHPSFQWDNQERITNSLPSTKLSECKWEVDRQFRSLTKMSSHIFTLPSSFQMESKQGQLDNSRQVTREWDLHPLTSVSDLTAWVDVVAWWGPAATNMHASNANNQDMEKKAVLRKCEVSYGLWPKYLHYNVWHTQDHEEVKDQVEPLQCLADWTKTAKLLPTVPLSELNNPITLQMINSWPDFFKIITPINVDHFEAFLASHPNCPFVESVCRGFHKGFWPWANTHQGEYPPTVDESLGTPTDGPEADFLHEQQDHERLTGRFSGLFGQDLLPVMHASPVHTIPKPHSDKLRMVIDQSTGLSSPNLMIRCEDVHGFPLDNMTHLREGLICQHQAKPDQSWILYKSDVTEAYQLLPMHPLWQIKQIVTIDGEQDVDQNNCFRGWGSPGIYISFNGLVTWIAWRVKLIKDLWTYMDDSFGINEDGNLV